MFAGISGGTATLDIALTKVAVCPYQLGIHGSNNGLYVFAHDGRPIGMMLSREQIRRAARAGWFNDPLRRACFRVSYGVDERTSAMICR